ncbi:MAG: ribosome-associated translation inhibitor RaiA [Planctomycetales bacterium]|nr:ribosome-associated translation inhibitor RaiA [Planctomycetales bacterium]
MQIRITARHGRLSEATQEKIRAKLSKLTRIFDRITTLDATFDLEDEESPSVDVRASLERHDDIVASFQASDMMGALDHVVQKLEQQLRRMKEKTKDRHPR